MLDLIEEENIMVGMMRPEETLDRLPDFLMNVELRLSTLCLALLNKMELQRDVIVPSWIW